MTAKSDEEEWERCQHVANGWVAGHFMRVTKRERELARSLAKLIHDVIQRERAACLARGTKP